MSASLLQLIDIRGAIHSFMHLVLDAGYGIRFVGGCVRDEILGIEPHDYDLATSASPDELKTIAQAHKLKVIDTGLAHGTVTVLLRGVPIEVTTLRVDQKGDGRHAQIAYTTDFVEDAARRDFTINAISRDVQGQIYDPFGGQSDLQNKVLRFIGDPHARIQEDYLRVLRYFRFLARFHLTPLPEDLKAIRTHVRGLEALSAERVRSELKGLLDLEQDISEAWDLLVDLGVLQGIWPQMRETPWSKQMAQNLCTDKSSAVPRFLGMMLIFAWCHPPGLQGQWITDLKLTRHEMALLRKGVLLPIRTQLQALQTYAQIAEWVDFLEPARASVQPLNTITAAEKYGFMNFLAPLWSKRAHLEGAEWGEELQRIWGQEKQGYLKRLHTPLIRGQDLEALGFLGVEIGRVYRKLRDEYRNGTLEGSAEAFLERAKTFPKATST